MPSEKDIKDCKRVVKTKFRRNIFQSHTKIFTLQAKLTNTFNSHETLFSFGIKLIYIGVI